MKWLRHLPAFWLFGGFLASLVFVSYLGSRLKRRSPLAFRTVDLFGFRTGTCVAVELARDDSDLRKLLRIGLSDERPTAQDIGRSVDDDTLLIIAYSFLFLFADLLVYRQHGLAVFLPVLILILAAATADFLENRGIHLALQEESAQQLKGTENTSNDVIARGIRRPSLVKWFVLSLLCLTFGVILFFFSGIGAAAVVTACVGLLFFGIGFYCMRLLVRWGLAPHARW